ncbi:MAG TPA: DUF5682 family protein [Ktedonobacterales bacterium]|nr:DUF5682 family protein [Ktedonobacterales bacterium]
MATRIFGIRHHGPGSARALCQALEELAPDLVLVEGPPDAHGVLPLLANAAMRPPVALLIYAPETPQRAAFYPFTHFSPEWQALSYALRRPIPVRFMDLPQAIQLARQPEDAAPVAPDSLPVQPAAEGSAPPTSNASAPATDASAVAEEDSWPDDPIGMLSRAAGYSDHERWWEEQIEQRRDMTGLFDGVLEAMTALRAGRGPRDEEEAQREAHMRQTIRAAQKEGFERIAVVCGAWHAPALVEPGPARSDAALLAKLPKTTVAATWIPWTNSRLSYRSGYGAGIQSPGWYGHLWTTDERGAIRWVTRAAHLLREEGLDASSASIIEAVRLAEALAAMRGLPMPGMAELHEAIQTTLCSGDTEPMTLIRDKLEIGEAMGAVPDETPAVPLQRDVEARQRRLRLQPSSEIKQLDLDLRNDTDRARSRMLRQLHLLAIPWGEPQPGQSHISTFHEIWRLRWRVEFVVNLIEANIYGNTLDQAANARAKHDADAATDLPDLTALLNRVMLADLPDATTYALERVAAVAAVAADVRHLMEALPPLAQLVRYSDVRGTSAERVLPVLDTLFERAVLALPGACASLDDDAAATMIASIEHAQESVMLLDRADQRATWQAALRVIVQRDGIHGLVRGRCCRLLLEQHVLSGDDLRRLAGLALSPVNPAEQAAAWVEGVLRGSGLLLLHQEDLWLALDAWLRELPAEMFVTLLPLLRRAFADFQPPERRAMGEKVKRLRASTGMEPPLDGDADALPLDLNRARAVLPVLAHILGVSNDGN